MLAVILALRLRKEPCTFSRPGHQSRIYTDYIAFAYLAGLVVLCLVLVIGHTVHANKSWLTLGLFNFQPSELVKVLVIAALAKYYAEIKRDYLELRELAMGGMIVFGPMLLLMLQGAWARPSRSCRSPEFRFLL